MGFEKLRGVSVYTRHVYSIIKKSVADDGMRIFYSTGVQNSQKVGDLKCNYEPFINHIEG